MTRIMALVAVVAAACGCQVQGQMACPGFRECVSSQAEADRLNAGNDCDNYVYCPPSDAGEGGGQDASPERE